MIGSRLKYSYRPASPYSAMPRPTKLIVLFKKTPSAHHVNKFQPHFEMCEIKPVDRLTCHDHGAIILGLFDGVIPAPFLIIITGLKHSKFEVQVGIEGQDDG